MDFKSDAHERLVIFALAVAMAVVGLAMSIAPLRAEEPITIVVLGDSLVAGFGLGPGEAFPEQLQLALAEKGHVVKIINAGVSGDTTSGGLSRLDWSIPAGTDAVIVELGANDALRGISPKVTGANMESIIRRLTDRKIAVLLTGMLAPPNMGKNFGKKFNAIYPRLADKYHLVFYPFFLDGVAADPKLNQADGIHPTAKGVRRIISRILPTVEVLMSGLKNTAEQQ